MIVDRKQDRTEIDIRLPRRGRAMGTRSEPLVRRCPVEVSVQTHQIAGNDYVSRSTTRMPRRSRISGAPTGITATRSTPIQHQKRVDDLRWKCVTEVVEFFPERCGDAGPQILQLHQPEGFILVLPSKVDDLDPMAADGIVSRCAFDPEVSIVWERDDKCPFFHVRHRVMQASGRDPARRGRWRHSQSGFRESAPGGRRARPRSHRPPATARRGAFAPRSRGRAAGIA